MKRFPLLLFLSLYESPTRANFVPLDINFAVTVTVYVCRYHFFHYLLHSPVMTDLHSLRLFIQHWTVVTILLKWTKEEEKERHWARSLSLSLSFFSYLCIDQIFLSPFFFLSFFILSKWNAKKKKASRRDVCLRSIDKRRAGEEVFVCIYTLETNKKWHTTTTTDASRCVSWSEKDIVHVRRSMNGSFKNWLLPILRRETSWIGSIKL